MSSWESQVTPQEVKYFKQLFQLASQSQDGIVTGAEAVRFFAGSGVPNQMLSEIWETADRDKVGYLTQETFAIALKLIACAQHGKEPSADVLSTVVSLPQFDGANGITPSPFISKASVPPSSSTATASNSNESIITPEDRDKYLNIFKVHQPVNGVLDANTAKSIFVKSKLPTDILSQIWNLADVRQSGTLNQTEFIVAMHYIAKLMDGTITKLPDHLPPAVYQSAGGSHSSTAAAPIQSPLARSMTVGSPAFQQARQQSMMTPPQRARTIDSLGNLAFGGSNVTESVHMSPHQPQHWDVTTAEKQQFDSYFDKIDSGNKGLIGGKEAVEFFKNSRLPEADLAHIWDLADIQQRGALSRDEFAVAMHLIHERLTGESLPKILPASLTPPSNRNKPTTSSPFDSTPSVTPAAHTQNVFASPKPPHPNRSLLDDDDNNDLLGDFADENISHETNQVNLLQNQLSSLSTQTRDAKQQTAASGNTLEQLLQQKKELEAQLTTVRMTHEAAVKDLNEIQETVRREEVEWNSAKAEYEAAQTNLGNLQNEVSQLKQTLENGRAETEHLRRRVAEIQEETRRVHTELDNLRAQTKQQGMMIDINRRQVTAAEQDRADAQRHLEDYRVAADLTKDDNDSDSSDDEIGAFAGELSKQSPVAVPHEQQHDMFSADTSSRSVSSPDPSKIDHHNTSTPTLDDLFGISAKSPESSTTSPFLESKNASNNAASNSSFDLFASNTNSIAVSANATSAAGLDDFDVIFGSFASPAPKAAPASATSSPQQPNAVSPVNDPMSLATNAAASTSPAPSPFMTSPTTTTTAKSTRGPPPPPPPQSRHHRQPSESMSSVTSGGGTTAASAGQLKKQRAPPPPPPTNTQSHAAIAPTSPTPPSITSIHSPSLSFNPATADVTATNQQKDADKNISENNDDDNEDDDDDFEAAFSGKELAAAKIVTDVKTDDFGDFDDAFKVFDNTPKQSTQPQPTPADAFANDDWASAFVTSSPSTQHASKTNTTATTTNNNDDWDAIFGTTTTTSAPANSTDIGTSATPAKNNDNVIDKGFDDAFASFGDDFGKQPSPMPASTASPSSFQHAPSPLSASNAATDTAAHPGSSPHIGLVGDKIEELVKMGFGEKEAKDALNRYDQDLEKASNFLLDQSTKQ